MASRFLSFLSIRFIIPSISPISFIF